MKDLIVFAAHLDDVELAFWGFISKHFEDYQRIKVIIATDHEPKRGVWAENLKLMSEYIYTTSKYRPTVKIEYINLGYAARQGMTDFDKIKDDFYKLLDFDRRFDILTHDDKDCHTDHHVLNKIAMGMYKYANRFVTVYSPSSTHFDANYWIPLDDEQWNLKREMCEGYDIGKEQSYSKMGYYLDSEEHWNIGKSYQMENFVHTDNKYYEVYRIIKWL